MKLLMLSLMFTSATVFAAPEITIDQKVEALVGKNYSQKFTPELRECMADMFEWGEVTDVDGVKKASFKGKYLEVAYLSRPGHEKFNKMSCSEFKDDLRANIKKDCKNSKSCDAPIEGKIVCKKNSTCKIKK